jgi:cytochrome P450
MQPGMTGDGSYIPAGTDIGVANYAIHHNEDCYPKPFEFRPTLWLLALSHDGGVTAEEAQLAQSAYGPFSVRRANCLSKNRAGQEMMSSLAKLVFLYEMRIKPGSTLGEGAEGLGVERRRMWESQMWDVFLSRHEGPMVQFRPR